MNRAHAKTEPSAVDPQGAIATASRLEIITIIWMVIEAAMAIGAGIAARSLLLVAFGIDSVIELASAVAVFRGFRIERLTGNVAAAQAVERKTAKVAGYLLLLLSVYVVVQAVFGLATRHRAENSPVGIAIALIAAVAMPILARAKLRVADKIDSHALRADAIETFTCAYLSWILLAGLLVNALTSLWWIDSVASLAIVPMLVREAWEAREPLC